MLGGEFSQHGVPTQWSLGPFREKFGDVEMWSSKGGCFPQVRATGSTSHLKID